jgi:hypothetical protein
MTYACPAESLRRLQTKLLPITVQLSPQHTNARFWCGFKILCWYNFNRKQDSQQADVIQIMRMDTLATLDKAKHKTEIK